MKTLTKILTIIALSGTMMYGARTQDTTKTSPIEFSLGYNALETAVTNDGISGDKGIRNRILVAANVTAGPITLGYSGLHDVNNAKLNTYFSRNVARIDFAGSKISPAIVVKATNKEILDTKYGFRDKNVSGAVGYGWTDITANKDGANIAAFLGRDIGSNTSFELFNSLEVPYGKTRSNYTEFQFNQRLQDHLAAFCRAEVGNFDFSKATYMAGIAIMK